MRRSSTSASARDLQTSSASSRRFRWSSPRSRWASSCSRSCSGAGGFAARRTTLNQNSCARVVSPRRPETGPSFQAFSKKFRDGFVLGVGGGNAPRVSTTGRTYSPMRQPLSIDVQSPLYTHLEVTTQSPDGDPHPTHLGHPHSHFVPPSFEAKPELLVCSGTRLDGDSSGHFALGVRRQSIGGRVSFGFVGVCIGRGPRGPPFALLPRQ